MAGTIIAGNSNAETKNRMRIILTALLLSPPRFSWLAAFVLIAVSCGTAFARDEVTAYPVPKGMEPSPDYQVITGGKAVFVYKTPVFSMATFAVTGEVDVEVKVQRTIARPVIRPLARGIRPVVDRGSLRIRLPGPVN